MKANSNNWQQSETSIFWTDIARNEHVVQLYENDGMLLNTLSDFIVDGFDKGDSVIVIATAKHLEVLNVLLSARSFDVVNLSNDDRYIPLDADEVLSKFMMYGMPDETYFNKTIIKVMERARKNGQNVRAFGEMVAMLWERGNNSAAIQLEKLWNKFSEQHDFLLFCAYPKSSFDNDASASIMHVCQAHSKIVSTSSKFPAKVQYQCLT